MAANAPVNYDVNLGGVQYGFNGQPKQSKGGKVKSSKKAPVKKNAPLTFKPANAYIRECNLPPATTSRKKTAESAYIKKNYGMDNTTILEPPNTFRKIETSCRDFSYGETISNLGSNILSSIERANQAGCSSPFSLWQTSDEEAMYKNLEDASCIKPLPPNDHPLKFVSAPLSLMYLFVYELALFLWFGFGILLLALVLLFDFVSVLVGFGKYLTGTNLGYCLQITGRQTEYPSSTFLISKLNDKIIVHRVR